MRRFATTGVATAASGLAFALWTFLTFNTTLLAGWDASALTPGVDLGTGWGQLTAACSFLFHPVVDYVVLAGLAVWAWRRRLRSLARALVLAVPLASASDPILKALVGRPRPPTVVPLVTAEGLAYPSGHLVGVSTLIVLVLAITVVTRRNGPLVWPARVGLLLLWCAVAYNRWALRAHYPTDIVAGGLWGAFVASGCLLAAGVHVVAPWPGRARPGVPPRVAVVVNPTKIADWETLRRHVDGAARGHGWGRPRWLETTPGDPGRGAARRALAEGADLVLASGGDGTIRSVCQALAGTGVALGILPAGTGNLLARNLGVPLDLGDALEAAFDGVPQRLDLVEVRADDGEPTASVVMAGMGLDAIIMGETDPDLKRAVGPAAYVVSAVGALSRPPFSVLTTVDAAAPVRRTVALAMIANVGQLQGGIQLVPDARPDDGLVDLLFADAHGAGEWAELAGRMVAGASESARIERGQGRSVLLETDEPVAYQVDGDTLGTCTRLQATVVPGALAVMVPR